MAIKFEVEDGRKSDGNVISYLKLLSCIGDV